jgi:2-methylisocitrate lyase-like PEP mutase family enzyme
MLNGASRLRELLGAPGVLEAPGAHDVVTARAIELIGFDAVYIGGSTVAAADYGLPDIGLVQSGEHLAHAERIVAAVDVPVFADLDDGGGNPLQIRRTVRRAEQIGLAGFHIEDMDYSSGKHFVDANGQMDFKRDRMRSKEQMVEHVKAAVDARRNNDTVIVARTDAVAITSLDDAIDRAGSYAAAGADLVFLCHLKPEDTQAVVEAVPVPLMNFVGLVPTRDQRAQMEHDGLKFLFYPTVAQSAAFQAAWAVLEELKRTGTVAMPRGPAAAKYPEALHSFAWTKLAQQFSMIR